MKKLIILCMLLLGITAFLSAEDNVVIQDIVGKVEVKAGSGGWTPAAKGMPISLGSVVSTGFNSKALVRVGASQLEIRPLTRMSVAEYMQTSSTVTTSIDLRIGKVKASVKSAEGLKHDFTIKSATSTASVRGTEFLFDGFSVEVLQGVVGLVQNESGTYEVVYANEESGGEQSLAANFETNTEPYAGADTTIPVVPPSDGVQSSGTLIISFE